MSDKLHQTSNTSYKIRIDGKAVYWPHSLDHYAIRKFMDLCDENPDCYVDIVQVRTEIVYSQYHHNQFRVYFDNAKTRN